MNCYEFEMQCRRIATCFRNMTAAQILKFLHFPDIDISKNIMESVVVSMFGGNSRKMADIELFSKMGLISKTIVLNFNNRNTEDSKFLPVDFDEI